MLTKVIVTVPPAADGAVCINIIYDFMSQSERPAIISMAS